MKVVNVRAIPMSDPILEELQHRTDLGTWIHLHQRRFSSLAGR